MLKYSDLSKGDILVSNFDEFEGEITAKVNFDAITYITSKDGKVRRIQPDELGGYSKKEGDTLIKSTLGRLEMEILEEILENKIQGIKKYEMGDPTVAYIVWIDNGEVKMGPVRWGHKNNYHTNEGTFHSWSASPFPGAWGCVPISKIVRVRSVHAM